MYLKKICAKTHSYIYLPLTFMLFSLPLVATAQPRGISFELKSFLKPSINAGGFEGLLLAILKIFIIVATPIIVLFIIYAGFLYVTARGNAEQVKQATRALTYSVIGGIIIIGALAIAEILKNVVESFQA